MKTFTFIIAIAIASGLSAQRIENRLTTEKTKFSSQLKNNNFKNVSILKSLSEVYLPTNEVKEYWSGLDWEIDGTYTNTYNDKNQLIEAISDNEHYKYSYNASGNKTSEEIIRFNGTDWLKSSLNEYLFDLKTGEEAGQIFSIWNGSAYDIKNGNRQINIYDGNDDLVESRWENYDFNTAQWNISDGFKIETDIVDGLIMEERRYQHNGTDWVLDNTTKYTYNQAKQIVIELENDKKKTEYEYDTNGVLITGTFYVWDAISTTFKKQGRYTNVIWESWNPSLGTENPIQTYTIQVYEPIGGLFVNSELYNATYSSTSEIGITSLWDKNILPSGGWVLYEKTEDYNPDSNNSSRIEYEYNTSNSSWIIDYKEIRVDNSTEISSLYENYVNGILESGNLNYTYFDSRGNETETGNKGYNNTTLQWDIENEQKYIYTYEGTSSKMLTKTSQIWNMNDKLYVNNNRSTYNYDVTYTNDGIVSFIELTNIAGQPVLKNGDQSVIEIYSTNGTLISQLRCNSNYFDIPIDQLSTGIYIIIVKNKAQSFQLMYLRNK